jgi:hypothetical protein
MSQSVVALAIGIHDTWVHQYVNPEQYGKNLELIFTAGLAGLARPHGKLVWSSTTPISSNCTGCGGEFLSALYPEHAMVWIDCLALDPWPVSDSI